MKLSVFVMVCSAIGLSVLVTACLDGGSVGSHEALRAPHSSSSSGREHGIVVKCVDGVDCITQATEVCSFGFEIVDRKESKSDIEWLIHCRAQQSASSK